ncbi:MAG TPA: dehydrogenase [Planctomycetes bacterium]|nr:dehydrogenase [Planctomycetota bacterium]HIN81038.1 dehydrogenase [Planctomycetota bacterium]
MTTRSRKPSRNTSKGSEKRKTSKKPVATGKRKGSASRSKSAYPSKASGKKTSAASKAGLDRDQLLAIYRNMFLSREIDEEEIRLKAKGQIFFQINGCGHEAVCTAAAMALRPGYDWFFPYYRDRALVLQLGLTPTEMFKTGTAAADEPAGAGRQMPSHWGSVALNIVNQSSCTGSQVLHAVGCAEAWSKGHQIPELQEKIRGWRKDEIAYVSIGDGGTSEGEVWEALSSACILRLPVLFLVEDNDYAISVPVEVNTPGGSISNLLEGYHGLTVHEVDGCDPVASYQLFSEVVEGLRSGGGPVLVHAHVVRPYSHSLSDDERAYRTEKERQEEFRRDPLASFPKRLIEEKYATEEELEAIRGEVRAQVREASEVAVVAIQPDPSTVLENIYSPDFDPTDRSLESVAEPRGEAQQATMVDLINSCLREEMRRDPEIVIFGEDVADASREDALEECKGKGGVFKVTHGLQREFGNHRVYNSPLAEANIVGRAIGMALRGMKPVVEVQFLDYIWPAYHQIRSELALMRWRSNGANSCPTVIRVACGGYLRGGSIYHSQSAESLFTHIPGLRVVMPSNAVDANGLLRTAIRCDDPVIFMEHKHLYRQTYNKGTDPGPEFTVPFGKAATVRQGDALTIITYGALVQRSLIAAKALAKEGIEVEILDLRSLSPYDWESIEESVLRTSKAIVVHEDSVSWGYGAEIAARISDELFAHLDAPVRRLGALDCFVAYAPDLEEAILPQSQQVQEAVRQLASY